MAMLLILCASSLVKPQLASQSLEVASVIVASYIMLLRIGKRSDGSRTDSRGINVLSVEELGDFLAVQLDAGLIGSPQFSTVT